MELFIWVWAYDRKRFSYDLFKPGYSSLVYMWLLPVLIGTTTLCFAYF